jgi:hypothetical protein
MSVWLLRTYLMSHITTFQAIEGVERFVGAKDIPGPNNYMVWEPHQEPVTQNKNDIISLLNLKNIIT